MKGIVAEGEELMKHRPSSLSTSGGDNHPEMPARSTPGGNVEPETPANGMSAHRTPIRKICRKRGLVTQARRDETASLDTMEVMVMEDKHMSPQDKSSVTGSLQVTVVGDKEMVKGRQEVFLTYKRRCKS
jgi:hypothetical protein